MSTVLLYGAVLLLTALLSARARRTALSASVLFLAAGFLGGALGWVRLRHGTQAVYRFADLALFVTLYADGMRIGGSELRQAWQLPGRALLLGLPFTLVLIVLLARLVVGLSWGEAMLLAAVLTPTDPVFASALVHRDDVAPSLRRLLNVESGLNDGLALPLVLASLSFLGSGQEGWAALVLDVAGGAALGAAVAWACQQLRRLVAEELPGPYTSFFVAAAGALVYSLAELAQLNTYIAAFVAGMTLKSVAGKTAQAFGPMGEHASLLLKFATLLVFGALMQPRAFAEVGLGGWLFVAGVLLLARPASMALALAGSSLHWRERLAAAWFGPKGFASLVYGILVLRSGVPNAWQLVHLTGVVVTVSIVLHSSSDVPVARWLRRNGGNGGNGEGGQDGGPAEARQ